LREKDYVYDHRQHTWISIYHRLGLIELENEERLKGMKYERIIIGNNNSEYQESDAQPQSQIQISPK
jgi:hypothetical protein